MRFIIHGAGAVGSLAGGMLANSGAEVILIAREPHADAVNRKGLSIKSPKGDCLVKGLRAVLSPAEIRPRPDDIIFLTVKTSQTAASVQSLREIFPEDTPVFCLQNGIRNEELAARRFLQIHGAMAGFNVVFSSPGVISQTMSNRVGIGNYPFGCDDLGQNVAQRLEHAGFDVTTHESIMAVKWCKLLLNLNNATFAIIDSYLQLGLATPSISHFMAGVLKEGLHVLEFANIHLDDKNNPYDIKSHIAQLEAVSDDPEKVDEAKATPNDLRTYPSTWMDLKEKRGETEAGYLNGEIILLGEKYGIPTPYNTTLLQVVETMAAEKDDPGRYTIEELADLVEQKRLMLYHN